LLSKVDWLNAVVGVALGAVATTLRVGWKTLWNRRPLRLFLDDLADDSKTIVVFVREMVSHDNKYYSPLPSGGIATWQNFPVVGRTDVEVATDVIATIAIAGRTSKPSWRSVATESDRWNDPLICVGGSFKADQVLALCRPTLVTFSAPDTFRIPDWPALGSVDTMFRCSHGIGGAACERDGSSVGSSKLRQ